MTCPSGIFVVTSVLAFFRGFSLEIARDSMARSSERSATSDKRFRGIVDATASVLTRTWLLLRLETRRAVGLVEGRRLGEEPMETHFSLEDAFDETQTKCLRGIADSVASALGRTDLFV